MRISIVNGFFLPVPPVSGGSTEKTWHTLGRIFVERGHEVTSISRRWGGYPDEDTVGGLRHLRLPGFDHQSKLSRNLLRDLLWSCRVFRALPPADIVVCNAVTLPIWLGLLKSSAGRVVVMAGRMPRGQYRYYSRLSRVFAPSDFVRGRLITETPDLKDRIRTTGYPIDWTGLSGNGGDFPDGPSVRGHGGEVTLGFVGRLHREKGLSLLADAIRLLREEPGVPTFRVVLCGPSDVERGGSGGDFLRQLQADLSRTIDPSRLIILEPRFDERELAAVYRGIDIFCYPSLPGGGETFGVGVAEAMAAGAVPVVSGLACFRDFVRDNVNGLVFDHAGVDPAARLASVLRTVIQDSELRMRLATQARADVQRYDFPVYADRLLSDFATLI
jgi:glycosyltransferase involved in cell wall biosynthesis